MRDALNDRDYGYLVSLANPYTNEPGLPIALYASREKAQDRCVAESNKRRCTVYVLAIQDGCILRGEYYCPGDQL